MQSYASCILMRNLMFENLVATACLENLNKNDYLS